MYSGIKRIKMTRAFLACTFVWSFAAAEGRDTELIKRGAMLTTFGGCADCHMPFKIGTNGPEKDVARGLSGHPEDLQMPVAPSLNGAWNWAGSATMTAFVGPWGVTYSANLTPDRETGIGNWKVSDFIRALRSGKHLGASRPILPPMPWQGLASLSDKDLRSIYVYLMAQPAIKNKVPDHELPSIDGDKKGK